ncbi:MULTISPECIES: vitamin B12 ABC transporter ATP-binding protein BtuD [Raoultella]|jgi:vitamin B12 transport system ATP-binding protein|uniref:vitamin B12 ABC transporter ATP-binding protein BtuD n=1 Tax=Raoultella TaxID=160674 RepID=UPI000977A54E|nr:MULTISPECIES: vitamin B12 ABC transporter ATP-binding protein BtuD [Raoultella]MCS4271002.1 vitamin B12 transport system ATP-binding protein [Raoultella sp. BIGb0132]MCS4288690.1 vitamin B12 transport system ATP-binding protein [Raoultella terrigena]OMP90728.1 vitamin B12 ABC transporter ATP-binding protein BtuD [Raoultella terrigena]
MSFLMQLQDVEEPGRLAAFSAEVRPGEMIHIVGPNGAGKSTLLMRMAGLTTGPGRIIFNERPLKMWPASELARHRAYLNQHQAPPFAMPVWHYLSLHLQNNARSDLLGAVAERLGLSDKLGRQVNQISGGEWQRVRLAAVILQIDPLANPAGQLLLLDEPMNSLDVAQQAALDGVLSELCAAGIAVVMSSHDLNHTLRHAQRAWLICRGKKIACGYTSEVLTEENLTAAYAISFQRVAFGGHFMLIASQ